MLNHTFVKRSLAAGLMTAAAAFPAVAQARYVEDSGGSPSAAQVQVAGPQPASRVASLATAQSSGSSFQWGDAGIGAAGAIVLLGAGGLGVATTRRRRVQRTVVG